MATWAIGDVQGCWTTFSALLDAIAFKPRRDRIWFAGDLVNRGQGSLEMLRWCVRNDAVVTSVLGNHELHLLARAEGLRGESRKDTLGPILAADDAPDLLAWVRTRPLIHVKKKHVLVHAGLLPQWSLEEARTEAARITQRLAKGRGARLLVPPPGADPLPWKRKSPSRRAALAALTTLRCVDGKGRVVRDFKGPPEQAPAGIWPWYAAKKRRWRGKRTLLFGHWAALGHRRGNGWVSLDSGCCWGGTLTAYRLEDGAAVQVPNRET